MTENTQYAKRYSKDSPQITQMKEDLQEVKNNYGRDMKLEDEIGDRSNKDIYACPYIQIYHNESEHSLDDIDEVIGIMQNRGYRVAYVDFKNGNVAMTLDQQEIEVPENVTEQMQNVVDSLSVQLNGRLKVTSTSDSYRLSRPVLTEIPQDDVENPVMCRATIVAEVEDDSIKTIDMNINQLNKHICEP